MNTRDKRTAQGATAFAGATNNPTKGEEDGNMQHHLRPIGLDLGATKKPKRAPRKPTLAAALKHAKRAGVALSGATVSPDGSVSLSFGKPADPDNCRANPWDEVLDS